MTKSKVGDPNGFGVYEEEKKEMEDSTSPVQQDPKAVVAGAAKGSTSSVISSKGTGDETKIQSTSVASEGSTPSQKAEQRDKAASSSLTRRVGCSLLRLILIDLPLILSFALYLATIGLERIGRDYLIPQIDLQIFTPQKARRGLTYYHRVCDASDQTAHDAADLTVQPDMTTDDVVDLMLTHGVTVIPNLLSEATATALRDFILEENAVAKDLLYVIENQQRWSFPIRVDQHVTVTNALHEMLNQPRLVQILEAIAGPNPAIIEFTAITAAYGAKQQFWHQDVTPDGNAAKYGRSFIPSYSLFVPLQNTTSKMGATGICPGTHMCSDGCRDFCQRTGIQVSGKADNWPLGAGALVNQQTTHRGEAHVDPNGPHRAVFILTFAPRPQTKPQSMETRLIGVSGSYSLHWSQWGHTLSDFQRPLVNMKSPWRELRSLGLYKPRKSQWGWDYITVSSGRIGNEDTGFTNGDLDSFVESGGFPWLPKRLQGNSTGDDENFAWVSTLLETVQKCRNDAQVAHYVALALSVVFVIILTLSSRQGRSNWLSRTVFGACKLVVIHAFLLSVAWLVLRRVKDSQWSLNIESKRSFGLKKSLTLHPDLPATLPTKRDIFMIEGMKSDYLNSYTRVLEVFQPGNKAWHEAVASFAPGYDNLSADLQHLVQQELLQLARMEDRRILVQTDSVKWAVAPDHIARWFSHKSLSQRSHPKLKAAVENLDFVLSEIRYGFWRDSSLHRNFVSKLVANLRDKVLGMELGETHKMLQQIQSTAGEQRPNWHVKSTVLEALPKNSRVSLKLRPRRGRLAGTSASSKLLERTWMQEGDIVESLFPGDDEEWYRARITKADSNSNTWEVEYEDGDVGSGLCFKCLRVFTPYLLNEHIEVRVAKDSFADGVIVAVNRVDGSFDIRLDGDNLLMSQVPMKDLRRRVPSKNRKTSPDGGHIQLAVGMKVVALLPDVDEDEWYPGQVTKVNTGGKTFAIAFDDGDFAAAVPRRYIDVQS